MELRLVPEYTHICGGRYGAYVAEHQQKADEDLPVLAQKVGVFVAQTGDHGLQTSKCAVQA